VGRYVLRRLAIAIPTLAGISLAIFLVLALAPSDPMADFATSPEIPVEVRENIRRSLGLDEPMPVRYVKWLGRMVQGDFGFSFASRSPVGKLILERLPATLAVVGAAYVLGILIAIPLGVLSAVRRYSLVDHLATTFAFVGFSLPTFFTGLVLVIVFAVNLHWLPFIYDSTVAVRDWDSLVRQVKQSIMPISVLALFTAATMTRYVRAEMIEHLPQDYVRTARSKGLSEREVVRRHVLRNSLIPVVTLLALGIPNIFSGAIVTEQIFSVPGLGHLLIKSIVSGDTPVVLGITFSYAVLVVVFGLIADVLYVLLDPRIKYT